MKIIDEPTLDCFRGPGVCELCLKRVKNRDPHHIHTRGAGRLDIRINLIALCTAFSGGDNCHQRAHDGHVPRDRLLAIVAKREGWKVEDIINTIWELRRAPKDF